MIQSLGAIMASNQANDTMHPKFSEVQKGANCTFFINRKTYEFL